MPSGVEQCFRHEASPVLTFPTGHQRHFPLSLGVPMMHSISVTTSTVTVASFSPDGTLVLTGSSEGSARIWEAGTGKLLRILTWHTQEVRLAEFSPDGRWIATAGQDDSVRLWNVQSGQPTSQPLTHAGGAGSLCFSPDSQRLITGGIDTHARVWSVPEGNLRLAEPSCCRSRSLR
jgi:WD40 repeat protein